MAVNKNLLLVCKNCYCNDMIFRDGYIPSEFYCTYCGQKYNYKDIKDLLNIHFELKRKENCNERKY